MRSIRARLFLILMLTTGGAWTGAACWIYFSTSAEVERALDARLIEAARMVSSLITNQEKHSDRPGQSLLNPAANRTLYERQLSCQIWALDGSLVGRSDDAPEAPLTGDASGFSENSVGGERWRVYAVENQAAGIRVLVGDNVRVRERLVAGVIKGLLIPLLLIAPIMATLIWLSVGRGLDPLNRMARALQTRSASDLSPLDENGAPSEILPVNKSLNGLFDRVTAARERERNFTAFAAHELRTPIAGLKVQAQIALSSEDAAVRNNALRQVAFGVDRTSRLLRQLMDITAAESSEVYPPEDGIELRKSLEFVDEQLRYQLSQSAQVHFDRSLDGIRLNIDPIVFAMAARNLFENAILHSPPSGIVRCSAEREGNVAVIRIDDEGPGIPVDELPNVRDSFFRGRNRTAIGSGLGLTIVDLALSRAKGSFALLNRSEGGLRAELRIKISEPRVDATDADKVSQCARLRPAAIDA
ncbi:ATP-binding protein [Hyphomicrobium facile]|uniref:histidine kinase n=1 Tax=Hyphomicrobium facile TaxID=51670 RepID=A0A1I7NHV3_9HYPH|nr:ATP-binding protein [Hyphomicrobium facile]SFV34241.1 two-component system, OmpR family, sensor histidine kinase QseC [Hyphomicrobium facile]